MKNSDRRIHPRINTDARCWLERESITLYGTVANISRGGLFLCTPVTLDVGDTVDLSMGLDKGRIQAKGRIIWANTVTCERGQAGLGIYFNKISSGLSVLDQVIEENIARKAG